MKNILQYYYNIDIDNYKNIESGICFYLNYTKYYFIKVNRTITEIEFINSLLENNNNYYHKIIKNINGDLITKIENKIYVLLKIKFSENNEISMSDILNNQIIIPNENNNILRRDNWGKLWSDKIDYLEYQVSELAKDYPIILSSFSYYIGLAENAIEYYNLINVKNSKLALIQKYITYPNINLNYYNPINLIIDFRVREIAEYIKAMFFNTNEPINELEYLINKNILSNEEYNILYARLLYPSYYFDSIYQIFEKKYSEEILIKYVDKKIDYEKFLKKVYMLFSKKCKIISIDWIIKK